jgi:hypothetical protein
MFPEMPGLKIGAVLLRSALDPVLPTADKFGSLAQNSFEFG